MKIWIVDAFTDRPFGGNPAAVAIVDKFPDDATCQKIAAEMNLSETAFVKKLDENLFHIRWFTPTVEVPLCGHGTLAAAHIINHEKLVTGGDFIFKCLSGLLQVQSSSPSKYTLNFPLAKSEKAVDHPSKNCNFGDVVTAARVDDDVVIELQREDQVKKYVPRIDELEKIDGSKIIITSKATHGYDFISRVFAPRMGLNEDPVCGSAHCVLALYWRKRLSKSDFMAYQASARGGKIGISTVGDRVLLSGEAVTVLSGDLQVPC